MLTSSVHWILSYKELAECILMMWYVVSVKTNEENLEKSSNIFSRFRKHLLKAKPSNVNLEPQK